MMRSGGAERQAGASGSATERVVLLTFHHRRVVPSGSWKMRFQSKGFSLAAVSYTHLTLPTKLEV